MLGIFLSTSTIKAKLEFNQQFRLVRDKYKLELAKTIRYYNRNNYYSKNNHILVRILRTLNLNIHLDLIDYVDTIVSRSPSIIRNFNMVSSINKGTWHRGEFYGNNTSELWVGNSHPGDFFNYISDWKNIVPVTVLAHPNTDLLFGLPENNYDRFFNEYAILEINIPMLALQYREWAIMRITENDASTNIATFVKSYVLPNMLYSHIDLVMINRLKDTLYNGSVVDMYTAPKLPFKIVDYSDKLDRVLVKIINDIHNTSFLYDNVLTTIPGIYNDTLEPISMLPNIPNTRQARPMLFISRLELMEFIIRLGDVRALRKNKHHINRLKLDLTLLKNDSLLGDMPLDVKLKMDKIINYIFNL